MQTKKNEGCENKIGANELHNMRTGECFRLAFTYF